MIEIINALIKTLKSENILSTKDLADNYYTVRELYEHRLALFKIICHTYPDLAWKTRKHFDGSMFNDSFLAGITTPLGDASYHFKIDRYDEFDLTELEKGPLYDGYTPEDVINRLNSLPLINNSYIDTGKSVIYKAENDLTALLLNPVDDINSQKMKRLAEIVNELIILLRDLDLIKTVDISDGNHKLKELYKQKRELFKMICHNYYDLAWKSKIDITGNIISEDTFMAGLNTPLGPVCYVLNDEHYNEFNIAALSRAPLSKDEIYVEVVKKISSIKIRKRSF